MKRHLTWVNLALTLVVVTLAAVLVWRQPEPGADGTTPQRDAAIAGSKPDGGTMSPEAQPDIKFVFGQIDLAKSPTPQRDRAASQVDASGMSLGPSDPAAPINNVDPLTGKAIGPNSPTVLYKGHTIAFCCVKSSGYTGGWERMGEAQKDAFVARFVK